PASPGRRNCVASAARTTPIRVASAARTTPIRVASAARTTPVEIARSLAACGLFLALTSCQPVQHSALARVRQAGVLRWGGDIQGGEPYVFEDPDHAGVLVGFEVELADAIAQELGVRAEFVQNDWSNLVPS